MGSSWKPSIEYEKVAKANILTYAKDAERYDSTETCLVSSRYRDILNRDIDEILRVLSPNRDKGIHALDACGGSGNISLKLLDKGVHVTLCDISPELIALYRSKCKKRGYSTDVECSDIGSFLTSTDSHFDLIVFSSALHHLYDYTGVLRLASSRLNSGGLLYTVFDGTKRSILDMSMLTADLLVFEVLHDPLALPAGLYRKLKRMKSGNMTDSGPKAELELSEENVGVLAEYYALSGIDDFALVKSLQKEGLEVIHHTRFPDARYAFFRAILKLLGRSTSFKLLMRKRD